MISRPLLRATVPAALVVALAAARAPSQAQPAQAPPPERSRPAYNPYAPASNQPVAQIQANAQATLPPAAPNTIVVNPSQYAPASYSYPYYPQRQTAINGYLTGVADVTNANAQYQVTIQQARLADQQVMQAKLETRRRQFDERLYEQAMTPTAEELREQDLMTSLRRSRNDPPQIEIWSGKAPNDLLGAILKGQSQGILGPKVPLPPEVLAHINLTTGTNRAGAGVLKNQGRFNWPLALQDSRFEEQRKTIETLARQASEQAASGAAEGGIVRDLEAGVAGLKKQVEASVAEMTPTEYVQSTRYLRELKESLAVLQDPNGASYFNGSYKARGTNVAELIKNMADQGLKFAPAAVGDEPYYTTLYRALASYDYGISQLVSSRSAPPAP